MKPSTTRNTRRKSRKAANAVAAMVALIAAGAGAEPLFPPRHTAPEAEFGAAQAAAGEAREAWYFEPVSAERKALARRDAVRPSPRPALYYFTLIRRYNANVDAELARFDRPAAAVATVAATPRGGS